MVLHGLEARTELNGEIGLIQKFSVASLRWEVRLDGGQQVTVKSENLRKSIFR